MKMCGAGNDKSTEVWFAAKTWLLLERATRGMRKFGRILELEYEAYECRRFII